MAKQQQVIGMSNATAPAVIGFQRDWMRCMNEWYKNNPPPNPPGDKCYGDYSQLPSSDERMACQEWHNRIRLAERACGMPVSPRPVPGMSLMASNSNSNSNTIPNILSRSNTNNNSIGIDTNPSPPSNSFNTDQQQSPAIRSGGGLDASRFMSEYTKRYGNK